VLVWKCSRCYSLFTSRPPLNPLKPLRTTLSPKKSKNSSNAGVPSSVVMMIREKSRKRERERERERERDRERERERERKIRNCYCTFRLQRFDWGPVAGLQI